MNFLAVLFLFNSKVLKLCDPVITLHILFLHQSQNTVYIGLHFHYFVFQMLLFIFALPFFISFSTFHCNRIAGRDYITLTFTLANDFFINYAFLLIQAYKFTKLRPYRSHTLGWMNFIFHQVLSQTEILFFQAWATDDRISSMLFISSRYLRQDIFVRSFPVCRRTIIDVLWTLVLMVLKSHL